MEGVLEASTGSRELTIFPGFIVRESDVFIDVGCGAGANCRAAASIGADVIAIDINPEYVAATVASLQTLQARSFKGIVTDSDPIPVGSETATAVTCMEVLEHVDHPRRFLAELVRIGKPGARYLLSVPSEESESMMKVVAPPDYFEKPNHVRVFERSAFVSMITDAGLNVLSTRGVGAYWTLWWVFRMACGSTQTPYSDTPAPPILRDLTRSFDSLNSLEKGGEIIAMLDQLLPKSYVAIAEKS